MHTAVQVVVIMASRVCVLNRLTLKTIQQFISQLNWHSFHAQSVTLDME